jgi:hypothetical protein
VHFRHPIVSPILKYTKILETMLFNVPANNITWQFTIMGGTATFVSGASTPFHFLTKNLPSERRSRVANFCAKRLGYPSMDVEMKTDQFTAFESFCYLIEQSLFIPN